MTMFFTKSRLYRGSAVTLVHVAVFGADGFTETVLELLANDEDHADVLGQEAIQILSNVAEAAAPPVAPP
jgi:hypothetical protein